MTKMLRNTCFALTMICFSSTSVPLNASAARPVTVTQRSSYPESDNHQHNGHPPSNTSLRDKEQQEQACGQAYCAGAYIPSLRPYLVVAFLIVTAVIVVCVTNNRS